MGADESTAGTPPVAGTSSRRLKPEEVRDLDRVREAIGGLTEADRGRLLIAAKTLLGGFRNDPQRRTHEDLLSEAVTRTLSGERQWPRRVGFEHHFFRTMRSLANLWRREVARERAVRTPGFDLESLEDHPNLVDPRPDPEAALIVRETVEAIRGHFADDEAATAVIMCMSKGLRVPQIRAVTGLTRQQVEATIKRIRRYARRGDGDHA
jgi:DNA-directed RNA polymerase specialized sigma24 family protein